MKQKELGTLLLPPRKGRRASRNAAAAVTGAWTGLTPLRAFSDSGASALLFGGGVVARMRLQTCQVFQKRRLTVEAGAEMKRQ